MQRDILILGATTRAAAFSALRAGYHPTCIDQFADIDLARLCPVRQIEPGAMGLQQACEIVEAMPPTSWFYTGGLENHPDIVARVSRTHRLWGVSAKSLAAVRDPFLLSQVLSQCRVPGPTVRTDSTGLPTDGSWLRKPRHSAGGIRVERFAGMTRASDSSHYYQQYLDGPSFSAAMIGAHAKAVLIGVTQQLTGIPNAPFGYRGSVGPVPLSLDVEEQLRRLGHCLAEHFGIQGWFGVDFILDGNTVYPVEVNPRYTASMEIHELAWRRPLLPLHIHASESRPGAPMDQWPADRNPPPTIVGKCVVYSTHDFEVGELLPQTVEPPDLFQAGPVADVPPRGTRLANGEPVLTVFATAPTMEQCHAQLAASERAWRQRIKRAEPDDRNPT